MPKTYQFANDLGYSSMKISLNHNEVQPPLPSVVAVQRPQNFNRPVEFDNDDQKATYFENLIDHMDVSVTSPSVELQGRFYVGKSAIDSGLRTRNFNVNNLTGKAEDDLSVILTLSYLANQAVSDAFKAGTDLSKILKINVNMATALPIQEAKSKSTTDQYAKRYLDHKHLVTLHNFDDPITVEISFKNVYVGFEGEMAQFKIANADADLKDKLATDFYQSYPQLKDDVNPDDLLQIENVMGIDIGEGTTDFSVIKNGSANSNASMSLNNGYGNVLQDAITVLRSKGFNFKDRTELNDYIAKKVSPLARGKQEAVKEIVTDQLEPLVDSIIRSASETMNNAGFDIELVYVYGGGSIPLLQNTDLRERLVEELKGFAGQFDIPVIWVDPTRARGLNEAGLELYVDSQF